MERIRIKRLSEDALIPVRATDGADRAVQGSKQRQSW